MTRRLLNVTVKLKIVYVHVAVEGEGGRCCHFCLFTLFWSGFCLFAFLFSPQSRSVPKPGKGCVLCPPGMPLELVRRHLEHLGFWPPRCIVYKYFGIWMKLSDFRAKGPHLTCWIRTTFEKARELCSYGVHIPLPRWGYIVLTCGEEGVGLVRRWTLNLLSPQFTVGFSPSWLASLGLLSQLEKCEL